MKNGHYTDQSKLLREMMRREMAGSDVGKDFGSTANRAQLVIGCAIMDFLAYEMDNGGDIENVVDAIHCGIAGALLSMGVNCSPNGVLGAIDFASEIVSRVGEAIVSDGHGLGTVLTAEPPQ